MVGEMPSKRALIVTVGTGTRPNVYIVRPLVKTIKDSRPDFLVLVVTEASFNYGEAIVREVGLSKESHTVVTIKDFDDFQTVFRDINHVFRRLLVLGYAHEEIQIDFTSGTKAMSSGAVLSAIYNQCQSIKYITGQRKNGVVVDGAEKFLTVSPAGIFALHDTHLARELIFRLRFSTADEILAELKVDLLDPDEKSWAKNLRLIAQAYRAWDIFDHRDALQKIDRVQWTLVDLHPFRPLHAGRMLLEGLAGKQKDRADELLLQDLFNNAVRRGREGKYDDAVARLYRTTELFAQQLLMRPPYEIQTGNVDLNRVPEAMRSGLEKNRDDRDGRVKIGLKHNYQLLAELGHPVGRHFLENDQLRSCLGERNESILAHGIRPITKRLYNNLRSSVLELFKMERPDFQQQAKEVQFPWLA